MIITEATQVSAQAQGYQDTPGLYTAEQVAGWRKVTERVHAQGGKDLCATVACGPRFPCVRAAGWRSACSPLCHPSTNQDLREQWLCGSI
jgi:2,4-dienoyl-CoA reductase-like NADH-dependent reductase (Old Yellow Enzyme family)